VRRLRARARGRARSTRGGQVPWQFGGHGATRARGNAHSPEHASEEARLCACAVSRTRLCCGGQLGSAAVGSSACGLFGWCISLLPERGVGHCCRACTYHTALTAACASIVKRRVLSAGPSGSDDYCQFQYTTPINHLPSAHSTHALTRSLRPARARMRSSLTRWPCPRARLSGLPPDARSTRVGRRRCGHPLPPLSAPRAG
jgi:hypothetical protein